MPKKTLEEMPTTIWMSSGIKNHAYFSAQSLASATLNQKLIHITGWENHKAVYGTDTVVAYTENFARVEITDLIEEYTAKSSTAMNGRILTNLQRYDKNTFITLRNELEEKIMRYSLTLPEGGKL